MYQDSYNETEKKHAIIDYVSDGEWGLFLATRADAIAAQKGNPEGIVELDIDTNLNSLILRAVKEWGCSPQELWISECARELVSYSLNGKRMGD
jgi:hypothetical protein